MRTRCIPIMIVTAAVLSGSVGAAGQDEAAASSRRRTPVVDVFERSRDAVANISSTEIVNVRRSNILKDFFDLPARPGQYTRTSVGSGFLMHPDGYLITNAHVVAHTAERKATFADGSEYEARIVAIDPGRDLAVLKIDAERPMPTLPLGRSSDILIGETVVAIGNPFGYQHTVTAGVVSAVGRVLELPNELTLTGLIQTDASINPGNSGGPLLNVDGELIGINSAIRGDAQNIGFAIPVGQLRDILPDLLDVERRYRVKSGLVLSNDEDPSIITIEPDSPAEVADLRVGDVLEEIDRRPAAESIDFHIAMIGSRPGDELDLTMRRGDERIRTTVRLAPRPLPDGARLARERLGIEVYPLPDQNARELGLPPTAGLLIVGVEPGGPADQIGLARRDVVVALGRQYVGSLDELGLQLERVKSADVLPLAVLRVDPRGKYRLTGNIRTR